MSRAVCEHMPSNDPTKRPRTSLAAAVISAGKKGRHHPLTHLTCASLSPLEINLFLSLFFFLFLFYTYTHHQPSLRNTHPRQVSKPSHFHFPIVSQHQSAPPPLPARPLPSFPRPAPQAHPSAHCIVIAAPQVQFIPSLAYLKSISTGSAAFVGSLRLFFVHIYSPPCFLSRLL